MWQFISEHLGINGDGIGLSWACMTVMTNLFWVTVVVLVLKARLVRREN